MFNLGKQDWWRELTISVRPAHSAGDWQNRMKLVSFGWEKFQVLNGPNPNPKEGQSNFTLTSSPNATSWRGTI